VTWISDAAMERLRQAADTPETAGTRYTIRAELGRGGMGTVYEAHDGVLDRPVALKVLTLPESDAAEAVRMLHEARVMARLEHPGIVPVHDAGTLPDGRIYYAMKLVRGERLDRWMADRSLSERLRAFEKVCDTVAFAHARGVIHRDLKPENVMIGEFGEVLVLDWGVARRRGDASEPEGTVLGTRAFMAPEQAAGRTALLDERADVHALGVILSGLAEPDGAGAMPRSLRSVAAKAADPEPLLRYPDAAALAQDVRRFLSGDVPAAHRERPFERVERFVSRHRTAILLVAAYVVMRALLILIARR
jgi:serine/threonine protein kinase